MSQPQNQEAGLKVTDFDFDLPEELIAQQPPAERGTSRMLVLNRKTPDTIHDRSFADLPSLLNPGDLLVLNDSRVIPARLIGRRVTSRGMQEPTGLIEVLLIEPRPALNSESGQIWSVLVRPGRKVRLGDHLEFHAEETIRAEKTMEMEGRIQAQETIRTNEAIPAKKTIRTEETIRAEETIGTKETAGTEGAGAFRPLNSPQTSPGFSPGHPTPPLLQAEVLEHGEFGQRLLRFAPVDDFFATLDRIGHMPLPPYIKRPSHGHSSADRERYQTVFAAERGSVAAPTAGLHFTPATLEAIAARGVEIARITLHVGLGTFAPLRVDNVADIRLHRERYTLSAATADALNRARAEGRRIVAVGTTTVRTLEHVAHLAHIAHVAANAANAAEITPHTGETSIFISPGFHFRLVGAMLTNFHLPQSSLLMLVSAFAGRERVLAGYRHAVRERYRFFSYGDCMFLA